MIFIKPIIVLLKNQFHFLLNIAKSLVLIQGLHPLRLEVAGGSQGENRKMKCHVEILRPTGRLPRGREAAGFRCSFRLRKHF